MPWRDQEFLGELLAALEPRGEPLRPEAGEARGLESIDDPRDQRPLGTDDREADAFGRASATSPAMSVAATGALRHFGSSAVPALPGATRTSVTRGGLRELPGQRMLAAAAADDEDLHGPLNAGSAACR